MRGWLMLAALVLGYDYYACRTQDPTMSEVYRAAFQSNPALVGGATMYLVTHLTGHLPERYDMLARACEWMDARYAEAQCASRAGTAACQ